jgi:hypothetical protein
MTDEERRAHAAYMRQWRAARASPEERAKHATEERLRYQSDTSTRARMNAYARQYAREHPEAIRAAVARYHARNPDKRKAHRAVRYAVRTGRLVVQPCWCGEMKVQAHHHNGYDAQHILDVVWLCRPHHRQAHLKP